jgi:hypothetical protein
MPQKPDCLAIVKVLSLLDLEPTALLLLVRVVREEFSSMATKVLLLLALG